MNRINLISKEVSEDICGNILSEGKPIIMPDVLYLICIDLQELKNEGSKVEGSMAEGSTVEENRVERKGVQNTPVPTMCTELIPVCIRCHVRSVLRLRQ